MFRTWINHITGLDAWKRMTDIEAKMAHNDEATQGAIVAFKAFVDPSVRKDQKR